MRLSGAGDGAVSLHHQPVADAGFGLKMLRSCRIRFELPSQLGDIYPQVLGLFQVIRPPYLIEQAAAE